MEVENINISIETSEKEVVDLLEKWIAFDRDFSDLVLGVIQGIDERVSEMEVSYSKKQVEQLKDQSHSLKGITGNFHMTELYEIFLGLDTYLKEYKKIDEEVARYIKALKHFTALIPSSYDERVILPPKLGDDGDIDLSILIGAHMKEIAEILIQLSYNYDINIDSADNGLEVLEKFYMTSYDLVILKNDMAIMSGREVEEELKNSQSLNKTEIVLVGTEGVEQESFIKKVEDLIEYRKEHS